MYKIHGDILDGDSIIITSRDYRKFYYEKQNQLLWTLIKALTAQYAVLFIGYSIGDENIQYMFSDIIEKVEKSNHNGLYLVSKGMEQYQIDSFYSEYGLLHIDQDLYLFLEELERKIKNDRLLDIYNQKIPISEIRESLVKEKDWEVKVTEDKNGKNITIIPKDFIPIDFSLKRETPKDFIKRFNDFISGASFQPFTISNEEISYFNKFNVDGIPFFNLELEDGVKKEITAYPKGLKGSAHLVLSKSGITITNLNFERYFADGNFLVRIFNNFFELSFYPDIDKLYITLHLVINPISDVIIGKNIFSFFKEWIEGDNLQIFTEQWKQALPIPAGSQLFNEPIYNHITNNFRLYTTLFKIQDITNKIITVPKDLSQSEIEVIDELIAIIFEEPQVKVGTISGSITLAPNAPISAKLPGFKLTGSKNQNYALFGTDFCLFIEYMITGIDVELVNYEEIVDGISKGETNFNFIVESSRFGFNFLQKLSGDQSTCNYKLDEV